MKTLDYLNVCEKKANSIVNELQQLLADFQIFYSNLRGLHWNITGHGFFILHEKFENMYDDAADKVDEIAERILMLGGKPENRFSEYLKVAQLKEVADVTCGKESIELILDTYKHLIAKEKAVLKVAEEAGDAVTVDMMTGYLKDQEKLIWMLVAFSTDNCHCDTKK